MYRGNCQKRFSVQNFAHPKYILRAMAHRHFVFCSNNSELFEQKYEMANFRTERKSLLGPATIHRWKAEFFFRCLRIRFPSCTHC